MMQTSIAVSGTGLITGLPTSVEIEPLPSGSGITFVLDGVSIPAKPEYVLNADRGVTLGAEGKHLSIVEHFLSACAMVGLSDMRVTVTGAPELPLLDGSAQSWVEMLTRLGHEPVSTLPSHVLKQPVYYRDPVRPHIYLVALPSEVLEVSYLVNFPHPDLIRRWFSWREGDLPLSEAIAPARTFGFVAELPKLQEQGLAKGVTLENTLGLTDEGGYTTPLRMPDEPIRHKILDLIGDLMLCGIPLTQVKAHIMACNAGHQSHIEFGRLFKTALS